MTWLWPQTLLSQLKPARPPVLRVHSQHRALTDRRVCDRVWSADLFCVISSQIPVFQEADIPSPS